MTKKRLVWQEGELEFTFPDNWASKYDDWSHYRNQFQPVCGGSKAVDLVFYEPGTSWLIEVKDYRQHSRTKAISLPDEIAEKVRDTLAGLVSAKLLASDTEEKTCARRLLAAEKLRVVCHLEQPVKQSRLRPRAIDPADVRMKLRMLLKAIDPHAIVVDSTLTPRLVPWLVR